MTPDSVIEDIIKALHSDAILDPFADFEPSFEFNVPLDPVARLTQEPGQPRPVVQPLAERESPVDVMTSTPQEKRIAQKSFKAMSDKGSSGSFQAAQALTMPEPKNWFKRHGGGPNGDLSGFIPLKALAPIEKRSHYMKPSAAVAYKAMQKAAKKDGINFSVTDSYRSYDQQVALKAAKPSLAATPGHSNHGWGLALDVNVNDPNVYQWLKNNAKRFGFDQPMSYEPWHWEYEGGYIAKAQPQPKTTRRRQQREPLVEPLNLVESVQSLISPAAVFGSVAAEVRQPRARSRREWQADEQSGGLGFVPAKYRKMFHAAAEKYNVPARLLAAMAQAESGFDPKAVSSAGAQGMMQVMPLHGLDNPFNARQSIMAGARIFSDYLNAADGNLRRALAYYNAGPNAAESLIQERMRVYSDPILDVLYRRAA